MRTSFPHISAFNCNTNFHNTEIQRQLRSGSLEPRSALEIHPIEHSKSAKYHKHNRQSIPLNQLWNPETQRLQLIKQQLQNPTALTSYSSAKNENDKEEKPRKKMSVCQLQDEEFRNQLRKLSVMSDNGQRKSFDSLNNNITEQEQLHRSISGLSTHQTHMLQKIWARATESEVMDCTRNIFAHLLRSNLSMYQFFNLIGMTDKDIFSSAIFTRQSSNFAMVFDYVITNLIDIEKVCLALQCLGERHTRLPLVIENPHWALFTRVFEDNPPKLVFQNAEGHSVWKTMVGFIIKQMRIGYDRAADVPREASKNEDVKRHNINGQTQRRTKARSSSSGNASFNARHSKRNDSQVFVKTSCI